MKQASCDSRILLFRIEDQKSGEPGESFRSSGDAGNSMDGMVRYSAASYSHIGRDLSCPVVCAWFLQEKTTSYQRDSRNGRSIIGGLHAILWPLSRC